MRSLILIVALPAIPLAVAGQTGHVPSTTLPPQAVAQLAQNLSVSRPHASNVWRDQAPINADGTVNGYVEISRGDLRKWEFSIASNARVIDRVMPASVGPYPVNYGFVPQTVSYDGDPFDILMLGEPLPGGRMVAGAIAGLFMMDDEKGVDSKVVLSPVDAGGKPTHVLTDVDRKIIGDYFTTYKRHEPGKFSRVHGWGPAEAGLAYVTITHRFFRECGNTRGPCTLRGK